MLDGLHGHVGWYLPTFSLQYFHSLSLLFGEVFIFLLFSYVSHPPKRLLVYTSIMIC